MKEFSPQETNTFLPYRMGDTARDTLQEFIDIDVTADDLVRILDRNQVYRALFFQFINRKAKGPSRAPRKTEPKKEEPKPEDKAKEPESPTFRLVSLLGMIGSRNLILALQLYRAREGKFPPAEEGGIDLKAGDFLKTAIEAEELFQRNKFEYSETAYAAGFCFDAVISLQAKDPNFKKLEPYFKEIAKRAQRTGVLAYLLAAEVSGMSPKHAAFAGMLTQIGKLLLASAFEDRPSPYSMVERVYDKEISLTSQAKAILEREEFGLSHEEVSAQLLRYFRLFPELAPVVRFFREPYCLKGVDAPNYRFAELIGLADRMAASWKQPVDEKDPIFAAWGTPATPVLKLKRETLLKVMKQAMGAR